MIERSLILGRFPAEMTRKTDKPVAAPAPSRTDLLEDIERRHILAVLDECEGNRAEAARRLGISRKTIDRKLVDWNG